MESLSLEITLGLEDWRAYAKARQSNVSAEADRWKRLRTRLMVLAVAVVVLGVLRAYSPPLQFGSVCLGMVIGAAAIGLSYVLNAWRNRPSPNGLFLGKFTMTLDREGIRTSRPTASGFYSWSLCTEIQPTPGHIFIWIDRISALTIPVRDLPPGMTQADALARIGALFTEATAHWAG